MAPKNIKMETHILSAVIEASCANCRPSCGLTVMHYSLSVGSELDRSAYSSLLSQYIRNGSFDLVVEIVEGLIKSGCILGTYLSSILILRLGYAGHSAYAAHIFRLFTAEKNVVTYTALINACFQAGKVDNALELFTQMRTTGISACSGTYEVLIHGYKRLGGNRNQNIIDEKEWICNGIFTLSCLNLKNWSSMALQHANDW
ncbi:pentatricopeptide repeat-containing protein At2g01390 [Phragmites australis]|uniref:pentatricopeptide repeat-containing protein At2g01390 n=1 Tax=Phragmites australis TaxID=29695 RepID=UPI002D799D65|nr:pentatricopeptide repeat-containing protein At2g01390 [Phragmites australis]